MKMTKHLLRLLLTCSMLLLSAGCVDLHALNVGPKPPITVDTGLVPQSTSPLPTPQAPTQAPTMTPSPTSEPRATETRPVPTITPTRGVSTVTPTSTSQPPTATPRPQLRRIRFPAGGTSATTSSTVTSTSADRYMLRAMAGQTLIVDIAASQAILLSVWGVDGALLKRAATGTTHWEGLLPATQDYVLQLTSNGGAVDYHLTVTIPAPVEPTPAAETYYDAAYGFEVSYPSDFIVGGGCPTQGVIAGPVVDFRLEGAPYYAGTNLHDACVVVAARRGEGTPVPCTGLRSPQENYWGQQEINGLLFSIYQRTDVATGHIHDIISYRASHADLCYEVNLLLHSSDTGVYPPGTTSEFDRDAVMDRLRQVLHSFRLRLG